MKDVLNIIGAHGNRRKNDFYPTPPETTQALIDFLKEKFLIHPAQTVWECACGEGAISEVLRKNGLSVWETDIQKRQDFFSYEMQEPFDWIITNPPFCLAEDFIRKSFQYEKPFAMLLKSQYWHSAKRKKLFQECQPTYILPCTWRPNFTGIGASMLDVMWCVWIGRSNFTQYQPLDKPKI